MPGQNSFQQPAQHSLSGRIKTGPDALLLTEVLQAQFDYELHHYLPYYLWIEKVLLLEYERMQLLNHERVSSIGSILDQITPDTLTANAEVNMSDMAFAIERYVDQRLAAPVEFWHVDRSRNDLQACAQVMFGRDQVLTLIENLLAFFQATHHQAQKYTTVPMPGYTHYQVAQIITPGFYLAALVEHILGAILRLLSIYDEINACPLGAGAMAGQHLAWDRERMAHHLGFSRPQRHALVSVTSREWTLLIANELSLLGTYLSRFATDLLLWGSSEYRYIDLPDELSGISSAMPQKKNFPVLERIRGRSAHLSAFAIDFVLGQRNTPYTNLVETSKEAGAYLMTLFTATRSLVSLFTGVLERICFRQEQMLQACEREFIGGFALANHLTLHYSIPYRTAQVIVGKYITRMTELQRQPGQAESAELQALCKNCGYTIEISDKEIQAFTSTQANLYGKQSAGSTHPQMVCELLAQQEKEAEQYCHGWKDRKEKLAYALHGVQLSIAWQCEKREG